MNTADLCTKLKELDINFNEEEHMKEECKDIRGKELATYISKITKLIEGNTESGDPSSAARNVEKEETFQTLAMK